MKKIIKFAAVILVMIMVSAPLSYGTGAGNN